MRGRSLKSRILLLRLDSESADSARFLTQFISDQLKRHLVLPGWGGVSYSCERNNGRLTNPWERFFKSDLKPWWQERRSIPPKQNASFVAAMEGVLEVYSRAP